MCSHSYLEVASVESSSQVLPDFHQFGSRASGTGPLFDGVLLQVNLKLAFSLEQLAQVIYTRTGIKCDYKTKTDQLKKSLCC